jgi:hypothetical protein
VALAALVAIGLVTAAWWALALYPAATAPDWVSRTRLACFGAAPGGLPNAGGWILLAGEPLGMLAMLLAAFGDAVRRDLRWAASHVAGRMFLAACLVAVAWGRQARHRSRGGWPCRASFATSGLASSPDEQRPAARLDGSARTDVRPAGSPRRARPGSFPPSRTARRCRRRRVKF